MLTTVEILTLFQNASNSLIPTASLLKAMVLNSGDAILRDNVGDILPPPPSQYQGYGMVIITTTILTSVL
jgi:hypothetical protein